MLPLPSSEARRMVRATTTSRAAYVQLNRRPDRGPLAERRLDARVRLFKLDRMFNP
jgi:hypothetical protein